MDNLTILATDAPHIAIAIDGDGLAGNGDIDGAHPLEMHTISGQAHQVATLMVVTHAVECVAHQHTA